MEGERKECLMLMIPILLTIVPGMLYQSMRLLARKKSTLTYLCVDIHDDALYMAGFFW